MLGRLHIEETLATDDEIALLPHSLSSEIERISDEAIELRFSLSTLTKMQRSAIGACEAENFVVRLYLQPHRSPTKFCVHLSGDFDKNGDAGPDDLHDPSDINRAIGLYNGMHCFGRPNRGCLQLSLILSNYLGQEYESLERTYHHINSSLSQFGSNRLVCGAACQQLIRPTPCQATSCQANFMGVSTHILLVDIWQDSPVVDLLVSGTFATASMGGKLELLSPSLQFPPSYSVVNALNDLPAVDRLANMLQVLSDAYGAKFNLTRALHCLCSHWTEAQHLADGLLGICNIYSGFLVSARGTCRIPNFGNKQFLLADASPDLEHSFSQHVHLQPSVSGCNILFHGTSLDRLYPILTQGLRVQSGTPNQRHGAHYGAGVYLSDEPGTAWSYANPTPERNMWRNSSFKGSTKVLLACELAGALPTSSWTGIYVVQDTTRLAVRYIFLAEDDAIMPMAKDVRIPLESVLNSMRNKTL